MDKLMVAAADTLQAPAISLQRLDQFTALHCVYYTHYTMLRPMAALRLSGQSDECLKLAVYGLLAGEVASDLRAVVD